MLARLAALPAPIRVAVIGMGAMGKGLQYQSEITPGIECVAVADLDVGRAVASCETVHRDHRIVSSLDELHDVAGGTSVAVCDDGDLLARCETVDVLIEASSSIAAAGAFAATALAHGKHVVMMNAEADLIFGPHLLRLAGDRLVYTTCDGDQPGVIKHLIDDLLLWGFDLVMAGNMKGFLDRYSDPTKIVPEADKRNLDYKMATAFTDGTKLCVEMALVANALGLSTIVPGMQGPRAEHVQDVLQLFDFSSLWPADAPVVDYILGAQPDGGVFAVGYCDHDYQQSMLRYYKMGDGPFYVFYRPYHLCHVEAMLTVAEAHLDGKPLLQPSYGFRTNVFAYAKRDLRRGEKLDGLGGYTSYGMIENCDGSSDAGLPICLADDVTLTRDVTKDEKIQLSDVTYDDSRPDFALFSKALEATANVKT
jgi:predicted homoserine dehydrogenase-like protein